MVPDGLTEWLLDSDPALRWQVERDLLAVPGWEATRARVATEGFGARLVALQDATTGRWAGGAFFPADFADAGDNEPQPWTATTWALNDLREWGLAADVLRGTADRLAEHARWEYEDLPYWGGEVDCCINGWTVANGVWLGADVDALAHWFVDHQMADGGWNCEWIAEGGRAASARSSFHSTLNALKGLLSYEQATGGTPALRAARHRGEEYLLARGLSRRLSTGEPVGPWVYRLRYPARWVYSVLNAAEYFRAATHHDGVTPDVRMADAVEAIRAARRPDGTWLQQEPLPGRVWFDVDVPHGEPSKWLTLSGSRVLAWWDG